MKVVLQRVTRAELIIDQEVYSKIHQGLVVLIGIGNDDTQEDVEWVMKKVMDMRIFSDKDGKMNLSLKDIDGELLLVSQFTLFASTKKGNRPSFINSAKPDDAIPLYHHSINYCREKYTSEKIKTGVFGANMAINLINDGPVTIIMDSKNKE